MTYTAAIWLWDTLIYQEMYSYTNRQVIHDIHSHYMTMGHTYLPRDDSYTYRQVIHDRHIY